MTLLLSQVDDWWLIYMVWNSRKMMNLSLNNLTLHTYDAKRFFLLAEIWLITTQKLLNLHVSLVLL